MGWPFPAGDMQGSSFSPSGKCRSPPLPLRFPAVLDMQCAPVLHPILFHSIQSSRDILDNARLHSIPILFHSVQSSRDILGNARLHSIPCRKSRLTPAAGPGHTAPVVLLNTGHKQCPQRPPLSDAARPIPSRAVVQNGPGSTGCRGRSGFYGLEDVPASGEVLAGGCVGEAVGRPAAIAESL